MKKKPINHNYLLTGLLTILPLFLTTYIIYLTYLFLSNLSAPLLLPILKNYFNTKYIHLMASGIGILSTIILVWIVGLLVTNYFGKKLFKLFEKLLEQIPFVKIIYIGIRRLIEQLTITKTAFRKVVMVEFPRKGMYSIGFITGTPWDAIQNATPEYMVNVFIPTTPNPTNGFLVIVPQNELIFLDITIDQAVFLVMSGGIITPDTILNNKEG